MPIKFLTFGDALQAINGTEDAVTAVRGELRDHALVKSNGLRQGTGQRDV